jgi:hypothetical protein
MKKAKKIAVIGKPKYSIRIPPSVGPANDPQKKDDDHIPK